MLEYALRAARNGLPVFQVRYKGHSYLENGIRKESNGKVALTLDYPNTATTDDRRIRNWWGIPGRTRMNVGLAMGGQLPDGRYLATIDVDMKRDVEGNLLADGQASFLAFCAECEVDPAYFAGTKRQDTPSGMRPDGTCEGGHLLVSTSKPVANSASKLGPGLDVRGLGGYIVGDGSDIGGVRYRMADWAAPILPLPEAMEDRLNMARERTDADTSPLPGINADRAVDRAVKYAKSAAPAFQGDGGDNHTFVVCAKVKDYGVTQDRALDILLDHWNPRCEPPWDVEELAVKVWNAYKHGKDRAGCAAPEAVFTAMPNPVVQEGETAKLHPLEKLNAEYAFVLVGGAGYILWETVNERGDPKVELINTVAFNQLHAMATFQNGSGETEKLTKAWMEWEGRRTYRCLCFSPGVVLPSDYYNLWRGFSITPASGDWSLMRAHIRDVICSGDPSLDTYVMGWLATTVQNPGVRAEVALVLRGGRGVGKGVVGNSFCRIFGRHGQHITSAKHLVGTFNGHLKETAFLFADEAFWAGDKQHESTLKGLVTEPTFMMEAKGKDAVEWPNCLHIMMASNDQWVVPAGVDERRFCVLDVASIHRQDHAYFKAMMGQMDNGGLEAMLHDLLAYNLTNFQIREIPKTQALTDQKLIGLHGADRWLYEVLKEGAVYGKKWGLEKLAVGKADVYGEYCQRSKGRYGEHHPQADTVFWKQVGAVMAAAGLAIADERPSAAKAGPGRPRAVTFPALADARLAFSKYLGGEVDWDGSQGENQGAGGAFS
jgi:hypothetical protein